MSTTPIKKRILISPLDWGLGHTTRCFPIISQLLALNVDIILAGNEIQKKILLHEFPDCIFLPLQGYQVQYSRSKKYLPLKILSQSPRLLKIIKYENKWLQNVVKEYHIDAVISDNRFGLYTNLVPCVFITHQLLIKTSIGPFAEQLLQKINYRYINKYSECWIPDYNDEPNLAGALSHPHKKPAIPCKYIGPLSRMQKLQVPKKANHLLFLLSGPEPQRSILEKIILEQLTLYKYTATIVRGLPNEKYLPAITPNITVHNHLSTTALNEEMCNAEWVICRSGYTSVMDINAIGAKAILVPTPGQTEQEFLSCHLQKKHFAYTCPQKHFNLNSDLQKARHFPYGSFLQPTPSILIKVLNQFINNL